MIEYVLPDVSSSGREPRDWDVCGLRDVLMFYSCQDRGFARQTCFQAAVAQRCATSTNAYNTP